MGYRRYVYKHVYLIHTDPKPMNKNLLFSIPLAAVLLTLISFPKAEVVSNDSGAPGGNTGSPFDNKTCARSGCHSGTATALAGVISSNIPGTGYIPGQVYTLTCSLSQMGISTWGFQVSPMNNAGTQLGTLIVTNPSQTQLTGVGSKYITHTGGGISGVNSKSWTFNWQAPVAGTGSVTFYGAFNTANGNSAASGDIIQTSTLTVSENIGTGIAVQEKNLFQAQVYPNPVSEKFRLSYTLESAQDIRIEIWNIQGGRSAFLTQVKSPAGNNSLELEFPSDLPQGSYLLRIFGNDGESVLRILHQ